MREFKRGMFAALIGFIVFAGCSDDDDKSPTQPAALQYLRPTTPENVLANLVTAYKGQDIDGYAETIADVFEFRPNQQEFEDVLNKAADEASVGNMFDEARNIEIRLDSSGAVASEYLDEYPPGDGYMQIVVAAARLEVVTTRDEGQGPITYLVDGDRALFMLKQTSDGVWQIVMQEDQH